MTAAFALLTDVYGTDNIKVKKKSKDKKKDKGRDINFFPIREEGIGGGGDGVGIGRGGEERGRNIEERIDERIGDEAKKHIYPNFGDQWWSGMGGVGR